MSDTYEFNPDFIAQRSFHGKTCGKCAWCGDSGTRYPSGVCRRVVVSGSDDWPEVPKDWDACPAFVAKGDTNE